MAEPVSVVLATFPDSERARRICRQLVEERVVACANLLPGATSIFRWEGSIEEESETLAVLKVPAEAAGALADRLVELHPYDVPEVLVLPVTSGSEPYLRWVRKACEPGPA